MGATRIVEAVTRLYRRVLAMRSKQDPSAGTATPRGGNQSGSSKKQPKKVFMLKRGSVASALPKLLVHVNLLLVVYGGASLATAARLQWDPSTYIPVRELLPVEYVAMSVGTVGGGLMLLLLPHLAAAALLASRPAARRILLLVYAGAMLALVLCELVLGAWLAWRLWLWLETETARQLFNIIEWRKKVQPVLQFFGYWFRAPQRLDDLIKETEQDAPRNLYVAVAAGAVLALLQPLAIALALGEACRAPPAAADTTALVPRTYSAKEAGVGEGAPLPRDTVDKNVGDVV